MKRYFRRRWNELRGDNHDDWGHANYYLELNEEWYAIRQLEIYDGGSTLKYDCGRSVDEFGMLVDQPLDDLLQDPETFELSSEEFGVVWASHNALNE